MIGKRIAHFEVTEKLGEGGMGAVYKAQDTHLDRPVALKVLLPEAIANPDRRRRFVQEAKAASALNHPNIIHIYDIDEADGELFIAMEYVEGKTLDQLIQRKGLPLADALRYAGQMADALATAHAAGIVHRDLKPSNIMVTGQGAVKVLDFGLAKLVERQATSEHEATETLAAGAARTAEGSVLGTAAYMSPEQAEGKPLDGRSDTFSFGTVLYEMVTGRRAFHGDTAISTISAVLRDDPPPASEIRKEVPSELERIIARCMRKDPARRFQNMADLRVALDEVKEESGARAAATRAPSRAWLPIVAVVLLAAGGLGAWKLGWLSRREAPAGSLVATQLTTSPGLSMGASLSPDGNSLAFSSNRSGRFEIYVRPANTRGSERQITSDGQQNIEPSWAPDGRSIAYSSAARHGIWVVPLDAQGTPGTPRQLAPFGSRPVWSPDGNRVAFRSAEPNDLAWFDLAGTGDSVIFVVGADGSNLRQVTVNQNPQGKHADPSWSADGKHLVFASLGAMGARTSINTLWTVDVASGESRQIPTGDLTGQMSPVLSSDGTTVYFSALSTDGFGIYSVPMSGKTPPVALLRTGREMPAAISITRDEKRLFYTRLLNLSQIWHTGTGAGGAKALYQDEVVRAKLPVYSPDGKRLVYAVQPQNATQDLWMMNADGSGAAALVSDQGTANGPGWTPDGATIWYSFAAPGVRQLRQIQIADGSRKVLLEMKEIMNRAKITPDMREVVYDTGRPMNIWIRPLQGGVPRQITFDREGAGFPLLSGDGEWIAYETFRGDTTPITVMDRTGSHQQILTSDPGAHYAYSFASDNRRIAYTACPDGVWNVYWIDRVTRETRQVTHYTAYGSVVRSPSWRPGTEEMAFEFTEVKGNVYALELPASR